MRLLAFTFGKSKEMKMISRAINSNAEILRYLPCYQIQQTVVELVKL